MDQAPRHRGRFAPGASGNPKGRPRRDAAAADLASGTAPSAAPARRERRDGWINSASGHGTARDRRTLSQYGCRVVTDLEAIALWRGDWLAARVVEKLPGEAFRQGYELKIEGDRGKKQAEQINTLAEGLGLLQTMVLAAQYERAYGGAAIFPVLTGAIGDLSEPLDESLIASVDALHVLEPRELMPASWYTDIRHPKWRKPQTYRLIPLSSARGSSMSYVEIHESRLIILEGARVTSEVQAGQRQGWGDSVLSRVREVIADDGIAWGSVSTILHEFSQGILSLKGLAEILSAESDGEAIMGRRLAAIDMAKSSLRTMVIDSEDRFERATTPLSGLPETLIQMAQRVTAAADMPLTILLGTSPAGLNATGESDIRTWYDRVSSHRHARYHQPVERLLRLIMLSSMGPTRGQEPEVWSIEWRPLWEPSGKERAEERKIVAETDKIYVDMSSASPEDVARSRWGGDTYSAEMTIDWEAREKQQELDEQQAEQMDAAALEAMGRQPPLSAPQPEQDRSDPPSAPDVED
jgi:hypothetical protein